MIFDNYCVSELKEVYEYTRLVFFRGYLNFYYISIVHDAYRYVYWNLEANTYDQCPIYIQSMREKIYIQTLCFAGEAQIISNRRSFHLSAHSNPD